MEIVEAAESAKLPNVQHPTVPSPACRSKSSGKRGKEKGKSNEETSREESGVTNSSVRSC